MDDDPFEVPTAPVSDQVRRAMLAVALGPLVVVLLVAVGLYLWSGSGTGDAQGALRTLLVVIIVVVATGGVGAFLAANRVGARIAGPLGRLRDTIARLSGGQLDARTGLAGADELSALGRGLDRMLDERIEALDRVARDGEELNDSVIEIMQAVGTIATTKDLTVRVPVTENVTGAIADALNLLTEETRRVLLGVRAVSGEVAQATVAVKSQSDHAGRAAAREQREVDLAARELAGAAAALNAIAERARAGDEAAERAVATTGDAMRAVASTADGVEQSRALIRETEKRIKRLGERSQEIGQAVGLVQGIAQRTGILALNASMQAAAAGEAGRAFATLSDEVKRLSESAREATVQVGRLVAAIQAETQDTVLAMNQAITQVVEISRLSGQAGESMRRTRDETESLAANVRDIARTSSEQAKVSAALQERARIIQEASGETARQLSLQAAETLKLVECARALLDQVGVFKVTDAEQ